MQLSALRTRVGWLLRQPAAGWCFQGQSGDEGGASMPGAASNTAHPRSGRLGERTAWSEAGTAMPPYTQDILIAVHITAKESEAVLAQSLACLARFGDTVHVTTCLALPQARSPQSKIEQARTQMQLELGPVLQRKLGITYRFHVLTVQHCGSPSGACRAMAQQLCTEAARLECRAIALGGTSSALRYLSPASLLMGHSTTHWVLKYSTMPVFLAKEGRLASPHPAPLDVAPCTPPHHHRIRIGLIKAGLLKDAGSDLLRQTSMAQSAPQAACRGGAGSADQGSDPHLAAFQRIRAQTVCKHRRDGAHWGEGDLASNAGRLTAVTLAVAHRLQLCTPQEDPIHQWLATAAHGQTAGAHLET